MVLEKKSEGLNEQINRYLAVKINMNFKGLEKDSGFLTWVPGLLMLPFIRVWNNKRAKLEENQFRLSYVEIVLHKKSAGGCLRKYGEGAQ